MTGRDNLQKIDHLVVVMMENRSFDHLLGHLSLEGGRADVDGLTGDEGNRYKGKTYPTFRLSDTRFSPGPCHDHTSVERQISVDMGGFVEDYSKQGLFNKHPGAVMGYYGADQVPVHAQLAREFTVADRWFSSVPGSTIPNRLYALSGTSKGETSNPRIPFPKYRHSTVFDELSEVEVGWRYYSHDFAFLRLFERHALSISGNIQKAHPHFYDACADGSLPPVTWIDPDFGALDRKRKNDDHAPGDIIPGQALVADVYDALRTGKDDLFSRTLLVVTYDEHGGFYDHVVPPTAADDNPETRNYGVRVPTFLVSPWVARGHCTHTVFDHTSIIKTILIRWCERTDGSLPDMGARVAHSNHLGEVLSEPEPRTDFGPAPRVDPPTRHRFDLHERTERLARRLGRGPSDANLEQLISYLIDSITNVSDADREDL